MSPDPIGYWGGMNMYTYVRNNPIRWIDPLGLDIWVQGRGLLIPSHGEICVGNPDGYYDSWGFGMDFGDIPFLGDGMGVVYRGIGGEQSIKGEVMWRTDSYLDTNDEQDETARGMLDGMLGLRDRYNCVTGNCWDFADMMFDIFEEMFGDIDGDKESEHEQYGSTEDFLRDGP